MTSIKQPTTLQSLLSDPKVNKSNNDVTWGSGWDGKIHTAQYRLGSDEAKSFVSKLGALTKGQQKSVLKELAKATAKDGPFVGQVSVISSAAAEVFEGAAKKLGLKLDFEVTRKRAPAPMG